MTAEELESNDQKTVNVEGVSQIRRVADPSEGDNLEILDGLCAKEVKSIDRLLSLATELVAELVKARRFDNRYEDRWDDALYTIYEAQELSKRIHHLIAHVWGDGDDLSTHVKDEMLEVESAISYNKDSQIIAGYMR